MERTRKRPRDVMLSGARWMRARWMRAGCRGALVGGALVLTLGPGVAPGGARPIPGYISGPESIVRGPDGNMWFVDGGPVGRITPRGAVTQFSIPDNPGGQLSDIASGPDGNVWVAEKGGRVGRVTPTGDVTMFPRGAKPPRCSECNGGQITAGPDGAMWGTDPVGARVWRLSLAGTFAFFSVGHGPWAITAGGDGNLWYTMPGENQIGRITPSGDVTEFPTGSGGDDAAGEITAGPDGNVWFTEPDANRIGRITPSGVVSSFPAGPGRTAGGPEAITTGPDGNLWYATPGANRIGRMTPSGSITLFRARFGDESDSAHGIAAGPDGNVWFTEPARGRIARITPNGVVSDLPPTPAIGRVRLRGTTVGARLRCPAAAAFSCSGVVWLFVSTDPTVRVGARRFALGPSRQAEFPIPLTQAGRRRLRAQGRLKLTVAVAPRLVPGAFPQLSGADTRDVILSR